MKKAILCAVLAALPLAAQSWEVGVFVGRQGYDKNAYAAPPLAIEAQPDSRTVGAIRLGYSLADLGPALFQINAAIQPKTSTTMKYTSAISYNGVDVGQNLDHQATSLGLMFHFKAGVALGAGVDYRWDKLEGYRLGVTSSTTYGRPWARASVGFAIPSPLLKPFLGLEVAAPLVTKSLGSGPHSNEDVLKAWAPKLQIGLYGGIRF